LGLASARLPRLKSWVQIRLSKRLLVAEIRAMAKSKKKVETVFLVCEETGDHNYTIRRKQGGEKLKLSKYSPRLRKRTTHVEKKK
jgi:large subunit ribosomal protein L33